MGSVYESLLAYSGFFASETLIEVKAASDKDGEDGTFLVPKKRRDDFEEDEILKDPESPERDVEIEKGSFVYRLNGRDRKKTASYYTPEVLTQTTVKYTLKGILDKLKERQDNGEECADEILQLKILEPAMGAAAFQNEVINQLSVAYLELKENEVVKKGGKRIVPGEYKNEIQKVKAYIASHNVYGVDLNPTAIELGKLSLWLNCMHKDMETPFFAHRLGVGNAVVGAWLKVYNPKEFIVEFPKEGTPSQRRTPVPKSWWKSAPQRVSWTNGKLNRKEDQIYHFLLPDENMVPSAGIKMLKDELSDAELKAFNTWKKDFKVPIRREEHLRLKKISAVIDVLLAEHYLQTIKINKETTSHYNLYGQPEPALDFKNYKEKERLARLRDDRSAPYFKLKTIMDYWCSLWFWDVRKVKDLPGREQWYNEVESILGLDIEKLSESVESRIENAGFENNQPQQTNLFGGTQLRFGGTKPKTYDQNQRIKQLIADHSADYSTLYRQDRIQYVQELSEKHRFFHNELEFIEVFEQRGGFDIISGNPPWVSILMDESGVLSDKYPEVFIRRFSAPKVSKILQKYLSNDCNFKSIFIDEFLYTESIQEFISSPSNYPELIGQRNNLYKCIIICTINIINRTGFIGLLHPEGIYEDPRAERARKVLFGRLRYHFEFKNGLFLFADVHDQMNFSINVYAGYESTPDFVSINNLYHPSTIDGCFIYNPHNELFGIKVRQNNSYTWNIKPHHLRKIRFTQKELQIVAKTFEKGDENYTPKLVKIHVEPILPILNKIGTYDHNLEEKSYYLTMCWDEVGAQHENILEPNVKFPKLESNEYIFKGPHFFVSNPIYKTPRSQCLKNSDYDIVDLTINYSNVFLRTNFVPGAAFISNVNKDKRFKQWLESYKLAFSRRLNIASERTLQASIFPPHSSHVNSVISCSFDEEDKLLELSGIASSLVMDFFVKSIGRADLYSIDFFPANLKMHYRNRIILRTLLLNCLNEFYAPLWERNWCDSYLNDSWSTSDCRIKKIKMLANNWDYKTPLRNFFERRQALIEIDVVSAMAFGLSLEELIMIYQIQFPVLQENEDDTWYDQKGNIVFTCSKGLTGVGLDRPEWEKITKPVNPMQRTLIGGDTYEHTITKSELYYGKKITYYAPFDKCDRVKDYKIAWKHFEKVFSENDEKETGNSKMGG